MTDPINAPLQREPDEAAVERVRGAIVAEIERQCGFSPLKDEQFECMSLDLARAALAAMPAPNHSDICPGDMRRCYVGSGDDSHWRCGTNQCGKEKTAPQAEASERARELIIHWAGTNKSVVELVAAAASAGWDAALNEAATECDKLAEAESDPQSASEKLVQTSMTSAFEMATRVVRRLAANKPQDITSISAHDPEVRAVFQELSDAVFGSQLGDEPNVYADYDKLTELQGRCRAALNASARDPVALLLAEAERLRNIPNYPQSSDTASGGYNDWQERQRLARGYQDAASLIVGESGNGK